MTTVCYCTSYLGGSCPPLELGGLCHLSESVPVGFADRHISVLSELRYTEAVLVVFLYVCVPPPI